MKQRTAVACCAAALVTLGGSTPLGSHAAFPAKPNGRIVFNDQNGSLVLVNADGTGIVRVAYTSASDNIIGASWSPDGKLIAYSRAVRDPDIYVIAPDASGQREITSRAASTPTRPGRETGRGSPSRRTATATSTSTRLRPTARTRSS